MKHDLKITIKESQKELARKITKGKFLRKPHRRHEIIKEAKLSKEEWTYNDEKFVLKDWYNLERNRYEFRHRHIAYCEMRGRTRNQIENKTNTPYNNSYITKLKEEWSHEESAA